MGALLEIARQLHHVPQEPSGNAETMEHTAPPASVEPGPACEAVLVCFACKGRDFWQGAPVLYTGGSQEPALWICARCHPRPNVGMKGTRHERTL